jgi:hypothetical protein
MPQSSVADKTAPKPNTPAFNPKHQSGLSKQFLTEDQVKEVVTEMLIAFELIPEVQKKKVITIE